MQKKNIFGFRDNASNNYGSFESTHNTENMEMIFYD